jgi:hypothetical protein
LAEAVTGVLLLRASQRSPIPKARFLVAPLPAEVKRKVDEALAKAQADRQRAEEAAARQRAEVEARQRAEAEAWAREGPPPVEWRRLRSSSRANLY